MFPSLILNFADDRLKSEHAALLAELRENSDRAEERALAISRKVQELADFKEVLDDSLDAQLPIDEFFVGNGDLADMDMHLPPELLQKMRELTEQLQSEMSDEDIIASLTPENEDGGDGGDGGGGGGGGGFKPADLLPQTPMHRRVLELVLDVATRWNAKFLMIDRYQMQLPFINQVLDAAGGEIAKLKLTPLEVQQLESVLVILRLVYEVTTLLEGESYSTLSLLYPVFADLIRKLENDALFVVRLCTFP